MTDKFLLVWNCLLMAALITIGVFVYQGSRMSPKQVVFDYCNNSRITDMTSEQTCGDLQDFYGMEFMCEEANQSSTNNCWVEKI